MILSFGLLALAGARVLTAAEVIGSGQEQARLLLSGGGASRYSPKSGFVSRSSVGTKSIALDAQEQAREMVLGREIAKTPTIEVDGSSVAGARRDRRVAGDPHEMARLMILGHQSAASEPKIRLTIKSE
ncbi:MAG: hypothetical protein ACYDAH_19460 [Steroidobacteraceae bacterium]